MFDVYNIEKSMYRAKRKLIPTLPKLLNRMIEILSNSMVIVV